MALNSTHPLYDAFREDWVLMRDCYAGERVVKHKGTMYLPATPAQLLDKVDKVDSLGWKSYQAYKTRAVFHDYVADAVEFYIGLLHQKPPTIELPDAMKPLLEKASNKGEGLETLLRRINEQQIVTGRLGLLLDFPENPDPGKPMPYIAMYAGEHIKNWDDSDDSEGVNALNLVVLDESAFERQVNLVWKSVEKYRVLLLDTPAVESIQNAQEIDNEAEVGQVKRVYMAGEFVLHTSGNTINKESMKIPLFRGQPLDKLPFVFINSKDIIATPDNPPLLGLGRLCMTIYRGEADYRNQLFLQGQDTLVVIGGMTDAEDTTGEGVRVGAGARLDINLGGDAKYVGVSATGLPEVRQALQADKDRAAIKSGQLASKQTGQKESAESLKVRLGSQTATLFQIAKAGAAALQQILRIGAEWMGQDPEKVVVTPNLEFGDFNIDGKEIVDLMSARTMGAPLSLESIHAVQVERGLTVMSFEEEMDKIAEEDAGKAANNAALGLDPTGQVIPDPKLVTPDNPTGDPAKAPGAKGDGKGPPAGGKGPASA